MELIEIIRHRRFKLTTETGLLGCFMLLPYLAYLSLLGLLAFTIHVWWRHFPETWRVFWRGGWGVISIAMILLLLAAEYPGEAALQLTNFIPFFWLFAAFAVAIPKFQHSMHTLKRWAEVLVLASIPVSLRGCLEYALKAPPVMARLQGQVYLNWLYQPPVDYGHRGDSVFGHPNVMACYLVMIFGLGLGLCWALLEQRHLEKRQPFQPGASEDTPLFLPGQRHPFWKTFEFWLPLGTLLSLAGIFAAGSRNGILVAVIQLLLWGWLARRFRFLWFIGIGVIAALGLGVLTLGVGGRSLAQVFNTFYLRLEVWQLAVDLMRNNPWFGAGLGSYKFHYEPFSIPFYETVPHAHNLWLMLGSELGIPMMVGFTLVVGMICYRGVRALQRGDLPLPQKAILAGYGLGFLGCSLFGLFDITFYDARVNVLGWLLLAVLQVCPILAVCHPEPGT